MVMPALQEALHAADVGRAYALLEAGADPNEPESSVGETPLQAAITLVSKPERRLAVVAELLRYGADPCHLDAEGIGPLAAACLVDDARVLEMLLRHGADPNAERGYGGYGLFCWARSHYLFYTYGPRPPEMPDPEAWNDPQRLLAFLDTMAGKHGKPRPRCLRLLWNHGARLSA